MQCVLTPRDEVALSGVPLWTLYGTPWPLRAWGWILLAFRHAIYLLLRRAISTNYIPVEVSLSNDQSSRLMPQQYEYGSFTRIERRCQQIFASEGG